MTYKELKLISLLFHKESEVITNKHKPRKITFSIKVDTKWVPVYPNNKKLVKIAEVLTDYKIMKYNYDRYVSNFISYFIGFIITVVLGFIFSHFMFIVSIPPLLFSLGNLILAIRLFIATEILKEQKSLMEELKKESEECKVEE